MVGRVFFLGEDWQDTWAGGGVEGPVEEDEVEGAGEQGGELGALDAVDGRGAAAAVETGYAGEGL